MKYRNTCIPVLHNFVLLVVFDRVPLMTMEKIEIFRNYCECNKVRVLKNRLHVWASISIIGQAIDAESLWIKLRFDGHSTSRTTVYHALRWLSEHGFVVSENNKNKTFYTAEELNAIQKLLPQDVQGAATFN